MLRKKAHVYVSQCYKWDPDNCQEVNVAITKDLLADCSAFLWDGLDEQVSHLCTLIRVCLICVQGHTNNLAHPALSGLIIDFFYTGAMSVRQLFPEFFGAKAPRVMVAISAMVVFYFTLFHLLTGCN